MLTSYPVSGAISGGCADVGAGKFAPQFSGYAQHDAQELLAFLLDGMHEDLNRVQKKPYIEQKDYEGYSDEVLSELMWKNHISRNQSVIVNLFQVRSLSI